MAKSKAQRLGEAIYTFLEILFIGLALWLLGLIGEMRAQEAYPYCGGTGSAIVGTWPAFSCTAYNDKCQIVVVPCSPAQRALIAFIGGHEVPTGNAAVSTRTPARKGTPFGAKGPGGSYNPKGTVAR